MSEVFLQVYDVTNGVSLKTKNIIVKMNKLMRDGMGLGGIFHGAIQVYGAEWSFGYCENGSGVFSCAPKQNPMYSYRESVFLGETTFSENRVNQILIELSREWPGYSYDLLSRNCNHFCEQFCERLGVQKLPGWVNRFAHVGDVAVEVAGNAIDQLRQAKSDITLAGKVAMRYISGAMSFSNMNPNMLLGNGVSKTSFSHLFLKVPWRNNQVGSLCSSSQEEASRSTLKNKQKSDETSNPG